jgi:hypothetical protein
MYVGDKFGRLTVQTIYVKNKRQWAKVICVCGVQKEIRTDGLKARAVISCGCFGREQRLKACTKHGQNRKINRTSLYRIWCGMLARCADKTRKYYGARGVSVCEEWHCFINFASWANDNGYCEGLMIDRLRQDCGYTPTNCRFTDRFGQNQHLTKRFNKSGYVGVDFDRRRCKWRARVSHCGHVKHLGYFDDSFSAAWVRDECVLNLALDFKTLNNLHCRRKQIKTVAVERRGTFDWKTILKV